MESNKQTELTCKTETDSGQMRAMSGQMRQMSGEGEIRAWRY